jgi:hypothetical protein
MSSEPDENKVEKVGVFFDAQKMPVNSPQLPRNSPQTDHQKTTFCSCFLRKPPAKTPLSPQKKKSSSKIQLDEVVGSAESFSGSVAC